MRADSPVYLDDEQQQRPKPTQASNSIDSRAASGDIAKRPHQGFRILGTGNHVLVVDDECRYGRYTSALVARLVLAHIIGVGIGFEYFVGLIAVQANRLDTSNQYLWIRDIGGMAESGVKERFLHIRLAPLLGRPLHQPVAIEGIAGIAFLHALKVQAQVFGDSHHVVLGCFHNLRTAGVFAA